MAATGSSLGTARTSSSSPRRERRGFQLLQVQAVHAFAERAEQPANLALGLAHEVFEKLFLPGAPLPGAAKVKSSVERLLNEGRTKSGGGIQVGPLKYKTLWRVFQERYADVAEDERQIHSLLFGAQFARAYDESRAGGDDRTRPPPPRGAP